MQEEGILRFCVNAIFPRFCLSCHEEGSLLCPHCFTAWYMQKPQQTFHRFSVFPYADPQTRQLLRLWKYHFDQQAFVILRKKMMTEIVLIHAWLEQKKIDVVMPIPLHPRRFAERGFNQAAIFGSWLAMELELPYTNILQRKKYGKHQAELSIEQRKDIATSNIFDVKGEVAGKRILLIDDVWTTGSTMRAAEKIVKDAGSEDVFFLTIAYGA